MRLFFFLSLVVLFSTVSSLSDRRPVSIRKKDLAVDKRDLVLRKDIKSLLKNNPELRSRIEHDFYTKHKGVKGKKRLGVRRKNYPYIRKKNSLPKNRIEKTNRSDDREDVKVSDVGALKQLENLLHLILPNLTKYFHIYKYVFLMMTESLSFRRDIKTFTREKEVREFLQHTVDDVVSRIKKKTNFEEATEDVFKEGYNFFVNKSDIANETNSKIYVSKKIYDEVTANEFFASAHIENIFINADSNNSENNVYLSASSKKIPVKESGEKRFFEKLFLQSIKKRDLLFFDYIKMIFFVYAYAVGLENEIVSQKDFFKSVLKNTKNNEDIKRQNISLVRDALKDLKNVIDLIGYFLESEEKIEKTIPLSELLKNKILEIEKISKNGRNNSTSYAKVGLGVAATLGTLLFLANNKNIFQFGLDGIVKAQEYFPRVTSVFQSAGNIVKDSLFFWNRRGSLMSKIYRGLTFGIGDRMLQSVHQLVDVGIDKIQEQTESKIIQFGTPTLLGVGLNYYFDSWFTGYFVNLFGKKASRIFNFSFFNEAKNFILDFIYSFKIFYDFDISHLPFDASLVLAETYFDVELVKGILIAIFAHKKAEISGLISTVKSWTLDRFL